MIEVCGACGAEDFFSHRYKHWGWPNLTLFNDKEILTCKYCGFSTLSNNPTEEALNDFYENHYRAIGSPFYIPYDKKIRITRYPMRAISQIALSKSFCNFKSGDYVLDLGSGFGDVLIASKKILINPRLAVIELTKGAIDFFKRNYDVKVFDSLKVFSAECSAKIIVLSHCLEHFRSEDIPKLFDDLRSSLAVGGVIMLEVPHVDMRIHAELRYPDTPHLLFFSKPALVQLIEKNGFELCYLQCTGTSYPYKFRLPEILNIKDEFKSKKIKDILRNYFLSYKYGRLIISIYRKFRKLNFGESPDVFGEFCDTEDGDVLRAIIKIKSKDPL